MLNILRFLIASFVIALIVPQTPNANIVLRALHSKRILENYGAERRFLKNFTWFLIFSFLIITFITSIQ